MCHNKLQHAGQKAGFAGGTPDGTGFYASDGQETRQEFGIAGNKSQRVDGQGLSLFTH